jgi:arsenite methyltransferase
MQLKGLGDRSKGERCCSTEVRPRLSQSAARQTTEDLGILAHPVRLLLLDVLTRNAGKVCVCDLEAAVPVKQPTVSHHLRLLREAGLIDSEKQGLWAYYFVNRNALNALRKRIEARLTALDEAVMNTKTLPVMSTACCSTSVSTGFIVRSAQASDLPAVQAILAQSKLPDDGLTEQFGPAYAVAAEADRVIGVVGIERYGDFGLLRSAAVAPAARGRGVAEALVLDRIDWSMRQGLRTLYLLTTTASDYFPRFGFETIQRAEVPAEVQASVEFTSCCPTSATVMQLDLSSGAAVRGIVRQKYGEAAQRAAAGEQANCGCGCGTTDEIWDPITADLYDEAEKSGLPAQAVLASLGCGNPTALAELKQGEVVLDLGSGGGIDVLLSAKRVGPTGKAYGLDMTDEMLELARANQRAAGAENVEFLKGEIENIPLPDNSVDVIISNCVINLSADKRRVLQEAYRVLKPGGRFAVSDVVVRGDAPPEVRRSMELWVGCVAGALEESQFRAYLGEAGFEQIDIEPTRVYRADDARAFLEGAGLTDEALIRAVDGKIMSAFIRGTKP